MPVLIWLLFSASMTQAEKLPVKFDLPAANLSETLVLFAKQAELSLLVSRPDAQSFQNKPVHGILTPTQALDRLLENTGLGFKFLDHETVSISTRHYQQIQNETVQTSSSPLQELQQNTIEELSVTAQRIHESLQQIPLSVSVIDRATLETKGINDLSDVGIKVPGLTVSSYSLGQPTIHMRGMGSNDDGAAMDSSVAVFIDDVYIGRITHIDFNNLDLEQVEVLRGPQGTLYGRNVIGGAIKLISKKPTVTPHASISLSTGNFQHRGITGIINGPIADNKLLGRLALTSQARQGWQENLILKSDDQHDDKRWGIKGSLLYQPHEMLSIQWNLDRNQENLNSSGRIPVKARTPIRILNENLQPIPVLDQSGQPVLDSQQIPVFETRLPTDIFADLGGSPTRATNSDEGYTDRNIQGISQRLKFNTDSGELLSITGYRESRFDWLEDSTGLPSFVTDQIIGNEVFETHRQFSQEIRWVSSVKEQIQYIAGLFYLNEITHRDEWFPFNLTAARSDQKNYTKSLALYGALQYDLSEKWTVNIGGRFTRESKSLHQTSSNQGAPAVILEDFSLNSNHSWKYFMPRLAVSYHASQDMFLYSSAAFGVKSGGFQGAPGTRELALRKISPESAWNYEAGIKSQWAQNKIRLNAAAFYTTYSDLQVVQFRTINNFGVFETDNAASASIRGMEIELAATPGKGITLSASYAFLRATYDKYNDLNGRDFTNNTLRQSPKHSVTASVHYTKPFLQGALNIRADYHHQSKSFREPDNNVTVQPSFSLVDGNITYTSSGERWKAMLWGKNLLDERYISHLFILGGNDYALYGTPRTYGISFTWNFQ